MNLRGLANAVTSMVNPNTEATYLASDGYTTSPSGKRTPAFASGVPVLVQEQAMTGKDLQQISGLNLQGELKAMYVTGEWRAVSRPDVKGGDMVQTSRGTWLVAQVLENWDTAGWCKVAVVRQVV